MLQAIRWVGWIKIATAAAATAVAVGMVPADNEIIALLLAFHAALSGSREVSAKPVAVQTIE